MIKSNKRLTSVRLPDDLVQKLNTESTKNNQTTTQLMIYYIRLGMETANFEQKIKDPEFQMTLEKLRQLEDPITWYQSLSSSQRSSLKFIISNEELMERINV